MPLESLSAVLNQVLIKSGALAVPDQFAGIKQAYLVVTRAKERSVFDSHDEPRTRVVPSNHLNVLLLPC